MAGMQRGTGAGRLERRAEDARRAIEALGAADRALAERVCAILAQAAPELHLRLWYGMPAWEHDGEVLCFLQPATKFGTRYATFGFQDAAKLDDGAMWPVAYALTALGDAEAEALRELVERALGRQQDG